MIQPDIAPILINMSDASTLSNQFLVAMPGMSAGSFDRSVTLLCEHSDQGALGLVINQPSHYNLAGLLDQLDIEITALEDASDIPIYWGGPVQQERGFVLHQPMGHWESSIEVGPDLGLTTSRDILGDIARGAGPEQYLITLGYAGWAAGQLETEIRHNSWLNAPATPGILFRTPPDQRWTEAARLIGVDVRLLSQDAGHA